MLRMTGFALLGLVTLVSPVVAQAGMGGGRMGNGGGREAARSTGGYGGADPALIQPPPAPAEMTTLAHLDTLQRARYASLFDQFMEDTRNERDSLRLGAGPRAGQSSSDRMSSSDVQSLARGLAHERKTFDGVLKELLTRDQWKSYQRWLEMRRKEAPARGRPATDRRMRRGTAGSGF